MNKMTFHECYGTLPVRTLKLIKKFNVSPADLDFMLDQFMFKDETRWDGSSVPADWHDIDVHIVSNSETGMYNPKFF